MGGPGAVPEPPPAAERLVRAILGFAVGVGLGLAPFLGTYDVVGFTPLLSLFPELPTDTRKGIIPLAAFLMGTIAVVVQFRAGETITTPERRRVFYRTCVVIGVAFLALFILHPFVTQRVRVQAANTEVMVLKGYSRPATCTECRPPMSDAECIATRLSLSPERIESCYGSNSLRLGYLSLGLPYFLLTGGFGFLIGVLLKKPAARRRGAGT